MHAIDQYAYSNAIRKLDPAFKAGFSLLVLILCLLIDKPLASSLFLLVTVFLTIFWAKLPAGFIFRVLLAEGSFLLFGVLGVAVSINTVPNSGAISFGLLWVNVTTSSLYLAFRLFIRSLGCASAMNFLALTTPLVDLIELFRRIHIPALLIDLMTIIYRFIFTLLDCLERMVMAQEVRLGFNGWQRSLQSAGDIAANLFIEAFRKSQKLETSLEGRLWEGSLRVLPQDYEPFVFPWHTSHS
jgi:cobalt/nickel transport system permease protein